MSAATRQLLAELVAAGSRALHKPIPLDAPRWIDSGRGEPDRRII